MGHHNIRYDGDPHALDGAWSPPTSRANFCEEDYAVSRYTAEFINSVSNIAYVYLALRYMYGPGSRGLFSPKVDFMSVTLLFLGIGSFLFHASLRQTFEFVDELSMMGLTWSMLHSVLTVRQPPTRAKVLATGLAVVEIGFALFYIYSKKIIYQVIGFVTGILLVTLRAHYLFHRSEPAFPREKSRDWNRRRWESMGFCVLGYLLWNIDLEFCMQLRELRAQVGLPWAWLLELHGWWHVLTAIGADRFMNVARELREEVQREESLKKIA